MCVTVAVPERDSLFSGRARPGRAVAETALLRSSHLFSRRADTLTQKVDERLDPELIGSPSSSSPWPVALPHVYRPPLLWLWHAAGIRFKSGCTRFVGRHA